MFLRSERHQVVERAFSSFAWPLQIQIDVGDSAGSSVQVLVEHVGSSSDGAQE